MNTDHIEEYDPVVKTFDEMYPNAEYLDQIDFEGSFLIRGGSERACWNCHSITLWIDYNFGTHLCSPECERQMWMEYFEAINETP